MLAGAARRIERLLAARAGDDAEALARDEPLLALLAAASLSPQARIAASRGDASAIGSSRRTGTRRKQTPKCLSECPDTGA